jgi:hypothetical protein
LSLAKTSSATKNGAILGRQGVNTISIASTEHRDFGEQGPVRACGVHTYANPSDGDPRSSSTRQRTNGERLRKCGTGQMNREIAEGLSQELRGALGSTVAGNRIVERAYRRIRSANRMLEQPCGQRWQLFGIAAKHPPFKVVLTFTSRQTQLQQHLFMNIDSRYPDFSNVVTASPLRTVANLISK